MYFSYGLKKLTTDFLSKSTHSAVLKWEREQGCDKHKALIGSNKKPGVSDCIIYADPNDISIKQNAPILLTDLAAGQSHVSPVHINKYVSYIRTSTIGDLPLCRLLSSVAVNSLSMRTNPCSRYLGVKDWEHRQKFYIGIIKLAEIVTPLLYNQFQLLYYTTTSSNQHLITYALDRCGFEVVDRWLNHNSGNGIMTWFKQLPMPSDSPAP